MPTIRDTLKSFFRARRKPTEEQFHLWLDSYILKGGEDGIFLDKNGNLGIGTNNPHAPLQFPNDTRNRKIVLWESDNNDHRFYGFGVNGHTLRYQVDGSRSDHVFFASEEDGNSSRELLRITGDGNIGIGTTIPSSRLHVKGSLKIQENNSTSEEGATWEVETSFIREGTFIVFTSLDLKLGGNIIFSFGSDGRIYKGNSRDLIT